MDSPAFLSLLTEARLLLEGAGAQHSGLLENWPDTPRPETQTPSSLPVLEWLEDIHRNAPRPAESFLRKLIAERKKLFWGQTYQPEDFGAAFLECYGWSKFLGPGSPLPDCALACGVLLLGPQTEYPSHSHAAEELYFPLSGQAEFFRDGGGWLSVPPLTPVHNPTWIPHAIKTGEEPLLALYLWNGDELGAKSKIN